LIGQGQLPPFAVDQTVIKDRSRLWGLCQQPHRAQDFSRLLPHFAANFKQVGKIGIKAEAELKAYGSGVVVGQGEFFKQPPLEHQIPLDANGFGPNPWAIARFRNVGVGAEGRQGKAPLGRAAEQDRRLPFKLQL
jgi:hypothetical protein